MKKNPDIQRAREEGRKFYVGYKPCKKCGGIIKYLSTGSCHFCARQRGLEKLRNGELKKYKSREKGLKKLQRWRKNNPEKYRDQWRRVPNALINERAGRYRCQKRNQTPDLTEQQKNDILEVYNTARKLTLETGVPHEVDHITPISKGGLHHPDNLQVLTKDENRSKSNKL